jgi:hypothetical protein
MTTSRLILLGLFAVVLAAFWYDAIVASASGSRLDARGELHAGDRAEAR